MATRSLFSTRARRDDMLKTESAKLSRMVAEWAESMGGVPVISGDHGQYFDGHDVETAAGTMRIHYASRGFVACRFEDTERANLCYYGVGTKAHPGAIANGRLNPFSGKFNFHFGRTTAHNAMDVVRHALQEFMTQPIAR